MSLPSRRCDYCGQLYEPLSKRSRFCETAHRMAAMRRRKAGLPELAANVLPLVEPVAGVVVPGAAPTPPSLYAATVAALEAVDKIGSADGVAALNAAARIDAGASGAAFRALHLSWQQAMGLVLSTASPKGGDIVDELEQRRRSRA